MFLDSSGEPSGSTTDNTTKYPYEVSITKPPSVTSETTTKYYSYVLNKFPSIKPRNMLIENSNGYQSSSIINIPNYIISSDPAAQTS